MWLVRWFASLYVGVSGVPRFVFQSSNRVCNTLRSALNSEEIRTHRLFLTRVTLADAKDIQRLAGDKKVSYDALNIPHPYESGMAEAWIESLGNDPNVFAIRRYRNEPLIGLVGLMIAPEHDTAELSYWIGKPYWGKGYATEAASAILAFGFDQLRLNRIYATSLARNAASARVLEKIGMTFEGCLRQHVKHWDVYEDVHFYGLLREEYEMQPRSSKNVPGRRLV